MNIAIRDWGKVILLAIIILCITALMMTNTIDGAVGLPAILAISGYLMGNGKTAVKRQAPSPTLVPKLHPDEWNFLMDAQTHNWDGTERRHPDDKGA